MASVLLTGISNQAHANTDSEPTNSEPTDTTPVVGLGAGDGQSWALLSDGKIKGWGEPYCDAIGCLAPTEIAPLDLGTAAVEVQSNGEYTIARLDDGSVFTWSTNAEGISTPEPMTLLYPSAVAQLAMGEGFMCMRFEDGAVQCEGLGGNPAPASISSAMLDGAATELMAGAAHACALLDTGAVQCWGSNDSGQLGSPSAVDTNILSLSGPATQIVAGGDHSCALLETGDVQCWGRNTEGQLGHPQASVGTVPLDEPAARITAGAEHSCAITALTQSLYCWGNDDLQQLGTGEDVAGLRRVDLGSHAAVEIFAGPTAWTTFAVLDDGKLYGWGNDDVGQLGYGNVFSWDVTTRSSEGIPDVIIYDGIDGDGDVNNDD
ncbi:MAG: hypothetical protein AAGF11_36770 [Myxococcota bacterium]